jgi:hypothetical protein
MTAAGFPHSDTPGSQLGCQLPRAYRRLQRPSSALDAKASTMRPCQLAKQTLNKNNKDTHYKNNTHTPHHVRTTVRAMLASTIQKSNNQRTTRPPGPRHPPGPGSDVSEPQQCAREPHHRRRPDVPRPRAEAHRAVLAKHDPDNEVIRRRLH